MKNDRAHKKNHTDIQKKQIVKNNGMILAYCCVGFVRAQIANYEKLIHAYNKVTETKTKAKNIMKEMLAAIIAAIISLGIIYG